MGLPTSFIIESSLNSPNTNDTIMIHKGGVEMDVNYFKETFHLDMNSPKPLYRQLYDYFKRNILTGILKEGSQMLPEIVLCEVLDVSRSTVRKTMDMLIEDGLLIRRRGKGSYITNPKLKRNMNYLYNFSENMQSMGATPSSIVLECKVLKEVPEQIKEILKLPKNNQNVFLLKRIRCADDEVVLYENTYIPYYLCPNIEHKDFSLLSLYTVLSEEYFLKPFHAKESIEAVFLNEEDKTLLKCEYDVPGFKISRTSYTEEGNIFEYTTSITRADKCVFMMELYKTSASNIISPVQVKRNLSI